jgi:hypothetical protein
MNRPMTTEKLRTDDSGRQHVEPVPVWGLESRLELLTITPAGTLGSRHRDLG